VFALEVLRTCGKCGLSLPLDSFSRYGKGGYQWWCKECFRTYFRERGSLHHRQVRQSKAKRKLRAQLHVLRFLEAHPCTDCGEADPVVLEFDHVGVKTRDVASMVGDGIRLDLIDAEIAQCEVVCANCHRRRTARSNRSWRADLAALDELALNRERRHRNVSHVIDVLTQSKCFDCGLADIAVLEFDHIGVKRDSVTNVAWGEYSMENLTREIAQCEIRCANCHRRRTAEVGQHFRHHVGCPRSSTG
jgi:hypothetical protein